MKTYGRFTRDSVERIAYTPSEAVRLRFEGWTQADKATAKPAKAEDSTEEATEASTSGTHHARTRRKS